MTDLLSLVGENTTLRRVANTGGGEYQGACPFCGGRDRFRVQLDHEGAGQKWWCRGCGKGYWHDAIDYIRRRDNVYYSLDEARSLLEMNATPPTPKPQPKTKPTQPPGARWQSQAWQIVAESAVTLWTDAGAPGRDKLHARGLNEETLRHWHIGYNPTDRYIAGIKVDAGIVIPCAVENVLWSVNVRRNDDSPKYKKVAGSATGFLGAATFQRQRAAVLTEGEFDALLLWQYARDMVGIGTFGSATARPDLGAWARYLLPVSCWLVAYDADDEGKAGARWWAQQSSRVQVLNVPTIKPPDKDITDFWKRGGNVRAWLEFELSKRSIAPSLPVWLDQSSRWLNANPTHPQYSARAAIHARKFAEFQKLQAAG